MSSICVLAKVLQVIKWGIYCGALHLYYLFTNSLSYKYYTAMPLQTYLKFTLQVQSTAISKLTVAGDDRIYLPAAEAIGSTDTKLFGPPAAEATGSCCWR